MLYLDLESRQYRIQDRMSRLIPGKGPDRLYISHESARVDNGLMQQIEGWIQTVEQPSLVIIDTLGRVKGGSRRSENAYESDTRILGELQKFGMEHKVGIVCVHHLRKAGSGGDTGDYFERVTGSMGITGACDAVILLDGKRDEATSTLRITGRDFEPTELVVRMERGAWRLESANSETWEAQQAFNKSPVVRGVIQILQTQERWEGSAGQLADAISEATREPLADFGANNIMRDINRHAQMLRDVEGIRVYTKRKATRRTVVIERDPAEDLSGF